MRRSLVLSTLVVAAAAVACAWPPTSRASALIKLGQAGYSGTLSSDPATRSQQLLCDPTGNLLAGSMTTLYDAETVRLVSLTGMNGFGVDAYVQAVLAAPPPPSFDTIALPPTAPLMVQISDFFANRNLYTETGLVRVLFNNDAGPRQVSDPNADLDGREYGFLGHDGPGGLITHGLTFDYLPTADIRKFVTYTNLAGPDDYLLYGGDVGRITDIQSASITGNVYAVAPLPSSAWAGFGLMGALAGARLVRARRAAPSVA